MKVKKKKYNDCAPSAAELILAVHDGTIPNSKILRSKRRKSKTSSLISWTPKKDVIDPSKYKRIKRRLAFLIVSGKRNNYIRKQLGITQITLDRFLQMPGIQESIQNMSEEIYTAAEREYQSLFIESVSKVRSLIQSKDGELALRSIEMLWKAHGRLLVGKQSSGDVNVYNNAQATAQAALNQSVDRDDAGNILEFLKIMKSKEVPDNRPLTGVET